MSLNTAYHNFAFFRKNDFFLGSQTIEQIRKWFTLIYQGRWPMASTGGTNYIRIPSCCKWKHLCRKNLKNEKVVKLRNILYGSSLRKRIERMSVIAARKERRLNFGLPYQWYPPASKSKHMCTCLGNLVFKSSLMNVNENQ